MTSTDVVVKCADLDAAVEYYSAGRGFALHSIFPADAPRTVTMTRGDVRLQLERVPHDLDSDGDWRVGRAGMRYRDLVPDRRDGRIIVSHICIPGSGPVPDYVHYHDVAFQLIYCHAGWVKVVYEGQGDPFVLHPGDAVLQPPGIRHRVLQSGDDLQVIEVSSPAEHTTYVDHDLQLPGGDTDPDRRWNDQPFIHHVAADAPWKPWPHDPNLEARDLNLAPAGTVHLLRPTGADTPGDRMHIHLGKVELQAMLPAETPRD